MIVIFRNIQYLCTPKINNLVSYITHRVLEYHVKNKMYEK